MSRGSNDCKVYIGNLGRSVFQYQTSIFYLYMSGKCAWKWPAINNRGREGVFLLRKATVSLDRASSTRIRLCRVRGLAWCARRRQGSWWKVSFSPTVGHNNSILNPNYTISLELASADESRWRFRMVASASRAGMFLFGGSPYLASPPTTTPSSRDRVSTTLLHYSYYYSTEYYTDYSTRVLLLYVYRNLQWNNRKSQAPYRDPAGLCATFL